MQKFSVLCDANVTKQAHSVECHMEIYANDMHVKRSVQERTLGMMMCDGSV